MLLQQFTPTQRFVTWSAFKSINYKIRVFWSNSYFRFKLPTALHSPDLLDDKHIQMEIWNDQEKLHHFLPQRPPVCKVKVELVTPTVHKGKAKSRLQENIMANLNSLLVGRVFLSADCGDSVTEGAGLALPKTLLHLYRLTENLHSAKTRGRVSPAWVVNKSEKIRKCCLYFSLPGIKFRWNRSNFVKFVIIGFCCQSLPAYTLFWKRVLFLPRSHKPEFIFCGSAVAGEDYSGESVAGWALHRKNNKTSRPASGSGLFVLSVRWFRSRSIRGKFILFLRSRRATLLVLVLWICRFCWPQQIIICRIQ